MGEVTFNRKGAQQLGKWLAEGAIEGASKVVVIALVILLLLGIAVSVGGTALGFGPADDSDVSWAQRSGVKVRHDALTGCEYLESHDGHLTPRLGQDGKQVCREAPSSDSRKGT